ncbi:hypothetical protein BD410DRAFT_716570 [Rickenella mellea]|uniref:Polysaccharide lyase 14 domain-containing protein n=1 Tax=Rickenella mellea TaxID=50990 RepID=A0A4Y7QEZ6_9AGAM|nr:hypothetical protein BD410DRAFT_716570 [Rickenella mellea]
MSSTTPAASIASSYSLTTSTSLPFPTTTLASADAGAFMVSGWSLSKGRIQDGLDDLSFVTDPFPQGGVPGPASGSNSSNSPVLQVTYPANSFSDNTGGAQFYSLWNTSGDPFQSMMLTYEVAFDAGFDWVKGGKLPGLRGGPSTTGCSGGNESNGTDCFSTRLMWRTDGQGEVYAYIRTPNNICKSPGILCNDDFGTSIDRGSFSFASGQWNRVTLLVQLNSPPNVANGNVVLYFNDVQAISQGNLQLRSGSGVHANGIFFSTFFGGSDISWETPVETHSYFRNFEVWGSSSPSNLTGAKVNDACGFAHDRNWWGWIAAAFSIFFIALS